MVVNYFPTVFGSAKDQSKSSMRFVVSSLQVPPTINDGGVVAQQFCIKIRKGECAHLFT
jgi:hypothetical protein